MIHTLSVNDIKRPESNHCSQQVSKQISKRIKISTLLFLATALFLTSVTPGFAISKKDWEKSKRVATVGTSGTTDDSPWGVDRVQNKSYARPDRNFLAFVRLWISEITDYIALRMDNLEDVQEDEQATAESGRQVY